MYYNTHSALSSFIVQHAHKNEVLYCLLITIYSVYV
jgi:hypothetical protein